MVLSPGRVYRLPLSGALLFWDDATRREGPELRGRRMIPCTRRRRAEMRRMDHSFRPTEGGVSLKAKRAFSSIGIFAGIVLFGQLTGVRVIGHESIASFPRHLDSLCDQI